MLKFLNDAIPILTFLSGSGIMYLLLFRQKYRRASNKMVEDEFMSLSLVVDKSSRQISELSDRLREMEEMRYQLTVQVNEAKKVIEELKQENETLKALIAQLKNHDTKHESTVKPGPKNQRTRKRPTGPSIHP